MKNTILRTLLLMSTVCLLGACEFAGDNYDVWTPQKGELTVWDDALGMYHGDTKPEGAEIGFPNLFLISEYIHCAPGAGPENKSTWVQQNGDLIDKMEKQWRESPYYTEDAALAFEFSCLEDLSFISYYDLWGRKSGEELVDMFLIKPVGPFFSFPDGDMLPDEEYDKWMTLEEWKSKACVCRLFQFKVKEPIDSENLIMMFTITVRNSWNTSSNTRKTAIYNGKVDGIYCGSEILSEEESQCVREWERAYW